MYFLPTKNCLCAVSTCTSDRNDNPLDQVAKKLYSNYLPGVKCMGEMLNDQDSAEANEDLDTGATMFIIIN